MATTPRAAATPSPPPHIHTPPTPRLGFADSWEPFSPRKSSRLASNAKATAAARTPSPSAATRRAVRQLRSPRQAKQAHQQQQQPRQLSHHQDIAALSPAPTPRKKKTMPSAHFLSPEDALKASKKATGAASSSESSHHTRMGLGMLPTPAKTPSKKYHAASQNESNIAAIARNLFHTDVDEVMSSPSKKATTPSRKPKKYTGFTLESFTVVEDEQPIPIFTDSQDRVPEADGSAENPFFGDGAAAAPTSASSEPARRRSKRNHVSIPGEGRQTVEDATRREDGLVYVFRGKKIFRKFEDSSAAQEEDILEGAESGKRLTRSTIKPRLLFPRDLSGSEPTNGGTTEDEEAVTDIEDHNLHETDAEEEEEEPLGTPADLVDNKAPNTPPNAPRFAPASPPITGRATRAGHKAAEEQTPIKASGRTTKNRSPFDGWRQTKSSAPAAAAGHKRPADELGSAVPTGEAKRSRS